MVLAIGWASSLVLVATISNQVWRQWRGGNPSDNARWLFAGQVAASSGFVIYSLLVKDWVFVTTNAVMLLNAVVGAVLVARKQSRAAADA